MKPTDAIRSATVRGSELLRMEREIGAIEAGKLADVIAVEGDLLQDIADLGRVTFVMRAGGVCKSPRWHLPPRSRRPDGLSAAKRQRPANGALSSIKGRFGQLNQSG